MPLHLALPVAVQRCAMGCALYLRRQGLVHAAMTDPARVRLVICPACHNALAALPADQRRS